MRRTDWTLSALAGLLLAIGGSAGCGPKTADARLVAPQDLPVLVSTVQPLAAEVARTTTQPATVLAWYESRVLAKTSGYVTELRVDIGQKVQAGETLAVVAVPELERQRAAKEAEVARWTAEERRATAHVKVAEAGAESRQALCAKAKADVARTAADAKAAQAELERITQLVRDKAVADRLLDEAQRRFDAARAAEQSALAAVTSDEAELALAQSRVDAAQADLEVAQASTQVARAEVEELTARLQYAELKSPLSGIVTERHLAPGDLVRNAESSSGRDAQPLLVVASVDKVRVQTTVPERDAPWVDVGDPARITFGLLNGREFVGVVARTSGVLDEQTRTLLVEIDLENPDGQLMPGMFGQATITLVAAAEKLTLPAGAVRLDEKGAAHVYVVGADNRIAIVPVKTGGDDGSRIEIVDGLHGQERIVGPLVRRLAAGQAVQPR